MERETQSTESPRPFIHEPAKPLRYAPKHHSKPQYREAEELARTARSYRMFIL